jgi:hypothetical protein
MENHKNLSQGIPSPNQDLNAGTFQILNKNANHLPTAFGLCGAH